MRTDASFGKDRLGILGGMGSEATAYFLRLLAQRAGAQVDQDHVPFLLLSCPEIPDRSTAIENGDTIVPTMIHARLAQLARAGCGAVAIACNTAHYWRDEFAAALRIPFIDMISATARQTALSGAGSAIVLGTRSTIRYRLYDHALNDAGVHLIEPDDEIVELTSTAISLSKAGDLPGASAQLARSLAACGALHADAVILGCTELPMVVPAGIRGIHLIDSVSCLAEACVQWWRAQSMPDQEVETRLRLRFRMG
ncbi:aspartate/glutamate racemase family protein [Mycetohabitans rhizoxinica]|uniref:Aspartate/glutamate racemase family protein n=1 Tax=Mycetohabitans rhizoxinica TaxID=412963 RepID=A0ABZ2PW25_9BURK